MLTIITGVTITENLTRSRYELYKNAMSKFGKTNVWTLEGRVMINIDGKKHSVTSCDQLLALRTVDGP